MSNVEWVQHVGFGCASLMRLATARARRRLLDVAYDGGIRYFDVARMYGLGKAEAELGQFARGKRDELTIATKFGIEPSAAAARWAGLQQVGRAVIRRIPAARQIVRRSAPGLYKHKAYTCVAAENSLSTSLTELQTDYVDVLLLHDPTEDDVVDDALADWLAGARESGRVRKFGLTGDLTDVCRMRALYPRIAGVLQFASDIISRNVAECRRDGSECLVTFSPFSNSIRIIADWLAESPARQRDLDDRVGLDLADGDALTKILLAFSVHANPDGVTVFSTTKPARLAAVVKSIRETEIEPAQVNEFAKAVADGIRSRAAIRS